VLALWGRADAALAEAEAALHTGAADAPLRQHVAEVRRRLEEGRRTAAQQQAQALRREKLLRDLDAARLQKATAKVYHFDRAGAAAKYRAAFAAYGMEVRAGDKVELARRIRAEEPAVRDALLVALHDWSVFAADARTEPPAVVLLALAVAAEDDAWRKRWHAASFAEDRAALRDLSAEARRSALPPASLNLLAASLFHFGEREEGLALLRWGRGQHPADFWVHYQLGQALLFKPDGSSRKCPGEITPVELEEAIGCNRAALALRPDAIAAHTHLATALKEKGQLDEAIAAFRQALRLKKDYAIAHNNLGSTLHAKGQVDKAIAEYREAIRLEKDFAGAHHNLGLALFKKGRLDEAIAEYRKAIRINKNFAKAHDSLGDALRARGKLEEAITEYRKAIMLEAIRLDPKDPVVHCDIGNALTQKGDLTGAIGAYRQAIALKPDFAQAHYNRGVAYGYLDQYEKAVDDWSQAIKLDPKFRIAWYNRGKAYGYLGKYDKAVANYSKAVELDPKDAGAHNDLAWLLATCPDVKLRDPKRAVELAKKAVQLVPKEANAWGTLGTAHYRAGDWKAAVAACRKAMEVKKGGDAYDWFILALASWKLDKRTEARRQYNQAVQWMEKNKTTLSRNKVQAEELRRFRSEAEQVLELNKK
jgi:tetratricopeptide (TPR) repeat protein